MTATAPPLPAKATRQTEPSLNILGGGGLGLIAGRDNLAMLPNPNEAHAELALDFARAWEWRSRPLTMLRILSRVHPTLRRKIRNDVALLCQHGAIRPRGMRVQPDGTREEDPEATREMVRFFREAGAGFGGITGGVAYGIQQRYLAGNFGLDTAIGASGAGITRLFTVDPLSVAYSFADGFDAPAVPFQRQGSQWKWLDTLRFFDAPNERSSDNPYGVPVLCTFLNIGLRDFDRMRDMDRAFHKIAWPHLNIEFDLKMLAESAAALGMGPDEAAVWVASQVEKAKEALRDPLSDDTLFTAAGSAHTLEGGNFKDTKPAFDIYGLEKAQALDTPPFLLGHTDTTTEAQAREQMKLAASSLETERAETLEPFREAGDLHFRLRGLPFEADFEVTPIRTTDEEADARVEATRTETTRQWVKRGIVSEAEAAMLLVGHAPAGEPMPGAYDNPRTPAQNEPSEPGGAAVPPSAAEKAAG